MTSTAATGTASLRVRLKEATSALHGQLDSDPGSSRVLRPQVTRADYIGFLERTYGFLAPLEEQLNRPPLAAFQSDAGLVPFQRAALIHADLQALGVAPDQLAALPTMAPVRPAETLGHAFGIRYVVEGSAMGGLVIAKHVQDHLGVTRARGGRFLTGDGEPRDVVAAFHDFVARLDRLTGVESDEADALAAAVATFAAVNEWFRACAARQDA